MKYLAALPLILLALLLHDRPVPYERPRSLTGQERFVLADRVKGIGRHTVIVGNEVIVIRFEAGGTRTIKRG